MMLHIERVCAPMVLCCAAREEPSKPLPRYITLTERRFLRGSSNGKSLATRVCLITLVVEGQRHCMPPKKSSLNTLAQKNHVPSHMLSSDWHKKQRNASAFLPENVWQTRHVFEGNV